MVLRPCGQTIFFVRSFNINLQVPDFFSETTAFSDDGH